MPEPPAASWQWSAGRPKARTRRSRTCCSAKLTGCAKTISVLVQYAKERHPAFPDVPAMVEFGRSTEDKQVLALFGSTAEIGRSLMTPPGVPAERLATLRNAFAAMVGDPAFEAEIEKRHMEFGPMSGEELQKRIADTLNVPPAVVARAIALSRN
jgi:tripartite-type tricarboxylate transporter receptor subunit TctC